MSAIPAELDAAIALHRGGRLGEAAEAYRRLVAEDPNNADAWHLLGVVTLQGGDAVQAETSIRRAIVLNPRAASFHANLAEALRLLGRHREAIASCREALRFKTDYAEALNTLGLAQAAMGELHDADEALRAALRLSPGEAMLHNNLATNLAQQGRADEAAASCREAIRLNPQLAIAYCNLAGVQQGQGRFEEAIANYERAVLLSPREPRFRAALETARRKSKAADTGDAVATSADGASSSSGCTVKPRAGSRARMVSPRTVLLGWELGGGFGHAKKLLDIADVLAECGARPVFVLKDVDATAPLFAGKDYPRLPAPRAAAPAVPGFRAASFADILAIRGYASVDSLWPLVEAWQRIIDEVRPDVIVADYAPTLQLAAHGSVPCVRVGVGFDCPPANVAEFPVFDQHASPLAPQSQLLAVVKEVQRRRGRPEPETLPELFGANRTVVCTLPELDQYAALRDEPAVGPVAPLPPLTPLPLQPRFYAYLSAKRPASIPLLRELAGSGVPGTAFVRGAAEEELRQLAAAGLEIQTIVRPLANVLPAASVVIHHGGLTSAEVLAAGRPQLLVPGHAEQQITSQMLFQAGLALIHPESQPCAAAMPAMLRLIQDPVFCRRAQAAAHGVRAREVWNGLEISVAACRTLLGQ